MAKKRKIEIAGTEITIISQKQDDYISLTDMAKVNARSHYYQMA